MKRNPKPSCILCIVAIVLLGGAVTSQAQYTGNYQTNIISGGITEWPGDYQVGSNTFADVLIIRNGGILSNGSANIGYETAGSGNYVLVTGSGSLLLSSNSLSLGYNGSGNTLRVESNAAVRIGGYGKGWFYVGMSGSGNRFILDGGTLRGTNGWIPDYIFGMYLGAYGNNNEVLVKKGMMAGGIDSISWVGGTNNSLTISGPEAVYKDVSLMIGANPYGQDNRLVVTNGGHFESYGIVVGYWASNDSVRVADPGSHLQANSIYIGYDGGDSNSVSIGSGGTVTSVMVRVGAYTNAYPMGNRIEVDGGSLYVNGSSGSQTGTLEVANGAVILNDGLINADLLVLTNGSLSRFLWNGGTLITKTSLVANGSAFVMGNGSSPSEMQLRGGEYTFSDGLRLAPNSILSGTGTVAATVVSDGTISPGFSPGVITILGNLTQQVNSVLSVEIGGLGQGNDYDWLQIIGSGVLDGRLDVALLNGFVPNPDNAFTVVTASASLDGVFDNVTPDQLVYLSTAINGRDAYFHVNEANGELILYDFQTVPEPSTSAMLALGIATLLAGRRFRRRSS